MKFRSDGVIHGDIGDGVSWLTTSADTAAGTVVAGQWYLVTYTITPTGYSIYKNGGLVGSGVISGTLLLYDATHTLRIGEAGTGGEYFDGVIDDVRIYNRALSATEIKQLYNAGR
jgi:Concanavalin A-like lectin/glucanases superfamily